MIFIGKRGSADDINNVFALKMVLAAMSGEAMNSMDFYKMEAR